TERRQLERQMVEAQKHESLGVLAGGIAHDFNNLLTTMLGYASLADAELHPGSPVRLYVQAIEQAARRAAELCQQMLAYSGKGRFVVGPVDLNAVIQDSQALLKASVSKLASLSLVLAPNLPPVHGDAMQLRQALLNLATNASEALGDA